MARTPNSEYETMKYDQLMQNQDKYDEVLQIVHKMGVEYKKSVQEQLTQIVVTGPQGTGKSSVLSKMTGIELPVDKNRCTRMPIVIQMRRANKGKEKHSVILTDKEGAVVWQKESEDGKTTGSLIKEAQSKAFENTEGDFTLDFELLVRLEGNSLENISMVDLPGFHNSSGAEAKIVNEMVAKYLSHEGSFALHITRGDQDYDTALGNDFLRDDVKCKNRITVLTHLDKVDLADCKLESTLQKTAENSQYTFAVVGHLQDKEEEKESLKQVTEKFPRLLVGVDGLRDKLAGILLEKMRRQIPDLKRLMQEEISKLEKSLDGVREISNQDFLLKKLSVIGQYFRAEKDNMDRKCKDVLQLGAMKIKHYRIRAILEESTGNGDDDDASICIDASLEVGDVVSVAVEEGDKKVRKIGTCQKVDILEDGQNKVSVSFYNEDGKLLSTELFDEGQVSTSEIASEHQILADIKKMTSRQGFVIPGYGDRQWIISKYLAKFADFIASIMQEVHDDIKDCVWQEVANSLQVVQEEKFFSAKNRIEQDIKEEIAKRDQEVVQNMITFWKRHYHREDAVFELDLHYVNDLSAKMLAADENMATDDGQYRNIMHSVRAHQKVMRKHMLHILKGTFVEYVNLVSEAFERVLREDTFEYVKLIPNMDKDAYKREVWTKNKQQFEKALKILQGIREF